MLKHSVFLLFFFLMSTSFGLFAQNEVWQWHVDVEGSTNLKGPTRAYLWISPDCVKLKGLILAQHNMEEISILESEGFRKAMAEIQFGIVWYNPMFSFTFNFKEGAGEMLNQSLEALAKKSGYSEINKIPYLAIGHSAAASWPYYLAAWNPDKTICAISVSGQWPYFRDSKWAPDIWENRNVDFVPCLETMGEYEAANTWSTEGLKERLEHPNMPLSMLACPAEGHFAASSGKIDYLIFYIKKAIHYRMPEGKLPLSKIDPSKTGWLADKWRINEEPHSAAAPVSEYSGDKAQAFWFFDEEHARVTERYQARFRNQKAALLGVKVDGKLVKQKNTHLQVQIPFVPKGSCWATTVEPVFLDTVPGESPRPANWTGLAAGSLIEKPTGAAYIEKICGPVQITRSNQIEIEFDRTCFESKEAKFEPAFAVKFKGDKTYKAAVQQAHMIFPAELNEGTEQKILFSPIKNVKAGAKKITLKAKSDRGLSVKFYVLYGPAKVEGSTLYFTPVPVGARFPIEVTVVAWQYGRPEVPKIQSAKQVAQTFYIEKTIK